MDQDFSHSVLGRTQLSVGRLGLAGSFGAPARTYEDAFHSGCNYFYIGSGRKRSQIKQAVRTLASQGYRDQMVVSVQTYARFGVMTEFLFKHTLKSMGIGYADILMLGWHNAVPSDSLLEFAMAMKEKGLTRFVGMSGHNRSLFARLAGDELFDLFHIRYNAAHQGAARDCFPAFSSDNPPGLVTYTATCWGHLLKPRHMPEGEAPLTACDCYRFALSDPRVNICLCGPGNKAEMDHDLKALEKGPLTPRETERICRIGAHVHAHARGFFF